MLDLDLYKQYKKSDILLEGGEFLQNAGKKITLLLSETNQETRILTKKCGKLNFCL
jgi:hypothetical protein